jgi:hypothetical protein
MVWMLELALATERGNVLDLPNPPEEGELTPSESHPSPAKCEPGSHFDGHRSGLRWCRRRSRGPDRSEKRGAGKLAARRQTPLHRPLKRALTRPCPLAVLAVAATVRQGEASQNR